MTNRMGPKEMRGPGAGWWGGKGLGPEHMLGRLTCRRDTSFLEPGEKEKMCGRLYLSGSPSYASVTASKIITGLQRENDFSPHYTSTACSLHSWFHVTHISRDLGFRLSACLESCSIRQKEKREWQPDLSSKASAGSGAHQLSPHFIAKKLLWSWLNLIGWEQEEGLWIRVNSATTRGFEHGQADIIYHPIHPALFVIAIAQFSQ